MTKPNRQKAPEYIQHIICRSISELNLFNCGEDKSKYLKLIKKYTEKFNFKIFGYCLMDNHVHIHLDPQGGDISKFMQGINLSYTIYYNNKYKRHGHLFQGRFENKIVTDDSYNITVSAYIHRNPKDIKKFKNKIYLYPYSSLGIYLGIRKDSLNLVDTEFVLQYFNKNIYLARKAYTQLLKINNIEEIEKIPRMYLKNEYRSERKIIVRNIKPKEIINFIYKNAKIDSSDDLKVKFNHKTSDFRAVCVLAMRSLCNFSYKQICNEFGNISLSQVAKLSNKGLEVMHKNIKYRNILSKIENKYSTAV